MPGIVKENSKTGKMQMSIGKIVNYAKKIHENAPENDAELKGMVKAFGDAIDCCLTSEPKRSSAEVLMEKIFNED